MALIREDISVADKPTLDEISAMLKNSGYGLNALLKSVSLLKKKLYISSGFVGLAGNSFAGSSQGMDTCVGNNIQFMGHGLIFLTTSCVWYGSTAGTSANRVNISTSAASTEKPKQRVLLQDAFQRALDIKYDASQVQLSWVSETPFFTKWLSGIPQDYTGETTFRNRSCEDQPVIIIPMFDNTVTIKGSTDYAVNVNYTTLLFI